MAHLGSIRLFDLTSVFTHSKRHTDMYITANALSFLARHQNLLMEMVIVYNNQLVHIPHGLYAALS